MSPAIAPPPALAALAAALALAAAQETSMQAPSPASRPADSQPASRPASQPTSAPAPRRPGWDLVWSDEFDYQGSPDPKKWTYEVGFIRNRERQYYTRARGDNARVENGALVIEARKERFPNAAHDPAARGDWRKAPTHAQYTSACLTTEHKASWTFGRIEVRAKLPHGRGVWPAIWTLGVNRSKIGWPRCGEIDIMEFVGKLPDKVHATVHYGPDGKHRSQGDKLTVNEPWSDFRVYAVEWAPDRMDFFLDETKSFTFGLAAADPPKSGAPDAAKSPANAFRQPHYLLLNLALGGDWGGPLDDSVLPQQFLIDYVRIYRPAGSPTTAPAAE